MKNEEFGPFGAWSLGLILFIATMVVLHWVVGFVTWSTLDSGWAQAIGAVLAILVAIYLSERQHKNSLSLFSATEHATLKRRLVSILAVLDQAITQLDYTIDKLRGEGTHAYLRNGSALKGDDLDHFFFNFGWEGLGKKRQFDDIVEVINRIPMHELGHRDLVHSVFEFRNALMRLDDHLPVIYLRLNSDVNDKRAAALSAAWSSTTTARSLAHSYRDIFQRAMNELLD